jgi:hypothetical protein
MGEKAEEEYWRRVDLRTIYLQLNYKGKIPIEKLTVI